ncbi:lysozyme inhibitor LprI family protein [Luteibacter sp. dw_328]|uniref:lysozyme inhibitor LprI family protein n=1 Tax=Luteibacter sp. dw_328 TaxID=2719796 RepID=UPI002104F6D0|nr:lysozyme inhibitor LprI family protein [Luteibacter sp. dw_328]
MSAVRMRLSFVLALGVAVSPAWAPPADADKAPPLRPGYDKCLEASQGVTLAVNNCIGSEYDFQDKRLNTAYKALRQSMAETQRIALRDQERAWIADRDKACAPPTDGGTADMLGANECRLNRTAVRAAELEAQLKHP